MLASEHALSESQGLLCDGVRLLVFALAVELENLLVEGADVLRTLCCNDGGCGGGEHRDHQDFRSNAPQPCPRYRSLQQQRNVLSNMCF